MNGLLSLSQSNDQKILPRIIEMLHNYGAVRDPFNVRYKKCENEIQNIRRKLGDRIVLRAHRMTRSFR